MRVGLALLTLFPGRVGGSETYVRGLLGALGDDAHGHRFTALVNRHAVRDYRALGGEATDVRLVRSYRPGDRAPTRLAAMAWAGLAPRRAARDVPAGLDVVHYPLTVPIPRFDGPTVVTIHDVQHLDLPAFFSRPERAYRRLAYEGAARRATRVITPSEHAGARLVELGGVAPDAVEVVPWGIDHARFRPEAAGDEQALAGLDLPERFVVYPANLWPHKNHERLVEALARVEDRALALVLTGQDYGRLEALLGAARRAGVAGRVRHLGFVARDAVPALYRRARALVFPSLYEGFGTPPLEAMACGCPVASSTRASLAEVIGDAAAGFDPGDVDAIAAAIDRVNGDEALRARLREAGLERAARYTWAAAARRHVEVYERAAESG